MKLYYYLDKQDYINFNIHHFECNKSLKIAINIQRFAIPLIFLMVPVGANLIFGYKSALMNFLFVSISIIWVFIYKMIMKRFMIKHIKNNMNVEEIIYTGERIFEINNNKILITTEEKEEEFFLKDLVEIQITKDYAFLYKSMADAYIIPFKFCKTEKQKTDFIKVLSNIRLCGV
ncbi:MAG: YcxB family protein [Sarcina sp.]